MTSPTMTDREFVGVVQLCERFGITRSSMYKLLDDGRIRSVRLGGRRIVPVEEADRFAAELRKQAR